MMPATAASAEPMTKVREITELTLTPIRPATSGFCEVARIARPSRVRCTSHSSPTMMSAASTTIKSCSSFTVAPAKSCGAAGSSVGKEWYWRPHTSIAAFCSTMDMPIAVMRAARRGACRNGR